MKVLAVIPARAGSKRLPNKNKLDLGGKPLIAWSIDSAKGIEGICDILVSTDDSDILRMSQARGALAPWLRPAELATDESHVIDTLVHAGTWYETAHGSIDGIMLLQPTSPFRTRTTITRALDLFGRSGSVGSVVSLSKVKIHPDWCFRISESDRIVPYWSGSGCHSRAQDLVPAYGLNGLVYVIGWERLKKTGKIIDELAKCIVVNSFVEAMDIDTEEDFRIAKSLCQA